jgi:hypothetical protein
VTTRIGSDPGEFATTLTVAVLAPPWVGTVRLGDGFVLCRALDYAGDAGLHVLSAEGIDGEYANETVFLSSDRAMDSVSIQLTYDDELTALLLSTDGLAPVAIKRNGRGPAVPNADFVDSVLAELAARRPDPTKVPRLLLADDLTKLSADDKTLLVAMRA